MGWIRKKLRSLWVFQQKLDISLIFSIFQFLLGLAFDYRVAVLFTLFQFWKISCIFFLHFLAELKCYACQGPCKNGEQGTLTTCTHGEKSCMYGRIKGICSKNIVIQKRKGRIACSFLGNVSLGASSTMSLYMFNYA